MGLVSTDLLHECVLWIKSGNRCANASQEKELEMNVVYGCQVNFESLDYRRVLWAWGKFVDCVEG